MADASHVTAVVLSFMSPINSMAKPVVLASMMTEPQ